MPVFPAVLSFPCLPVVFKTLHNLTQEILAHLQNKLLLSLAHYRPRKSVQEPNTQNETLLCSSTCERHAYGDAFVSVCFLYTKAKRQTHPMVFVDLVTNRVRKDPVRTGQTGRKIRMPVLRKVTEAIPAYKRANVTKMSPSYLLSTCVCKCMWQ